MDERMLPQTHIAASGEEKDVVDATAIAAVATVTATAATRAVATAAAAAGWQVLAGVEL